MVTLKFANNNSMALGYPKRIDQVWSGAPSDIDTVFIHWAGSKTYMFKVSYLY
jgi:hypothetical protein